MWVSGGHAFARAGITALCEFVRRAGNDTTTHTSAFSPRGSREFRQTWSASEIQRAQGMPGARCARGLACKMKKHTSVVTTGSPSWPGIPRAMVLRLIPRSPRWSGFVVTVAGGIRPANLTPASRRQDHTTSPSAKSPHRQARTRVHRILSRVRDDRERPSFGTGRSGL